ncbi:MAG: hypothetical protein ACYTAS_10960 [Planctomycetota bacterium]
MKGVALSILAVIALIGLYYADAPYLDHHIRHLRQTKSAGWAGRGSRRANRIYNPQDLAASSGWELVCSLPEDWQAAWRDGKLWITHYNPDGTVVDSLPFDGLGDFYYWVETHPDSCDVDVEKLELEAPEVPVRATTTEQDSTAPTSSDSGRSSPWAMGME